MNPIKNYAEAVLNLVNKFLKTAVVFFSKLKKVLKNLFVVTGKRLNPVFSFFNKRPVLTIVMIGILYFIGIASVLYPIVGNIYTLEHSRRGISTYGRIVENMSDEEIEKRWKNAKIYNEDLANGIYNDGYEKSLNNADGMLCVVEIPSVDIYLPVYYGTSSSVLDKGCGLLENTSLPIGGNSTHSVISGHTGLPNAEMFTPLDKVQIGEIFYIYVLDRVLAYKVVQIDIVTPDKTYLLEVFKDKDYCTLLTCTPYGINDKRLLVRGEHIYYQQAQEAVIESAQHSNVNELLEEQITHYYTIIIGITAVAVIIYIFACIWLFKAIKSKSAEPFDLIEDDDVGDNDVEEH